MSFFGGSSTYGSGIGIARGMPEAPPPKMRKGAESTARPALNALLSALMIAEITARIVWSSLFAEPETPAAGKAQAPRKDSIPI